MKKNIAVIGGGRWGRNIIRNFAQLGVLHTVCDNNQETLSYFRTTYPDINLETDLNSILTNDAIKGVAISVPAALHFQIARNALLADKDVFVEKPLALSVSEGEELIAIAKQRSKILMVGHLLEYHPAISKLKELVDNGNLGKIEYIYSNRLNLGRFRTEENILWSFAPHDISVILLLLNEMPDHVFSHGGYYLHTDIADVTVSTLNFSSGVRAHVFVSWLHPYKEQKIIVVGDKAMAVFDDIATNKKKLQIYEHNIEWIGRNPIPHEKQAKPIPFRMVEPLKLECQHFIDCVKSRQTPKTDGESALRVLRILDACQKSLNARDQVVPIQQVIPSQLEKEYFIHETSLVESPSHIGKGTKIWHFSHIMPGASIGENCNLGQNVFVAKDVMIGNNVKIQNNVSVFEGVTLESDVFCGPSCIFTNVTRPRSEISQKGKYIKTLVKQGATIGANATIVCGHFIGKYALIGAGSVITEDIPDYALAYGNPAKIHGWACRCGSELTFGSDNLAQCSECGRKYQKWGQNRIEFSGGKDK